MEDLVMVVAPHPDDAEIGMGGTIAKLIRAGVRVMIVDLTNGEPTPHGSEVIRAKETAAASAVLNITERVLLGLKNRELFDCPDSRSALANVIRKYKPKTIFAPYWEDAHPDHVEASKLVDAARFYGKFVKSDLQHEPHYSPRIFYYFPTHLRVRFFPSFVVDVSDTLAIKTEAILAFASQFVQHSGNSEKVKAIEREAKYWGDQVGVAAAEPFVCRETIKLVDPKNLLSL